jgi:hypothetical protein
LIAENYFIQVAVTNLVTTCAIRESHISLN